MQQKVQNETAKPYEQIKDDSPIDNVEQDKFGRSQFVQNLAKALITETKQETESKVIALTGKWGVGKTSVINMVKAELKKTAPQKLYILEFNPWQYTDSNDLIKPFLEELYIECKSKRLWGLKRKISRYYKTFNFPEIKNYFLDLVGAITTFIGFLLSMKKENKVIKDFIIPVSTNSYDWLFFNDPLINAQLILYLIPILLFLVLFIISIARFLNTLLKADIKSYKISIEAQKYNISKYINKKNRHFIFIVDDIDRLTPKEVLQVFRIVRSNADFSNTTYLLSFDKDVIIDNLEKEGINGKDFIEKIITTEYAIYNPPQFYLRKYLTYEVMDLIKISEKWKDDIEVDKYKFDQIIYLLSTILVNMRDIKRYSNSLKMHSRNLIDDNGIAEVNFIDLMVIECFMLKFRDCYYGIMQNKSYLLRTKQYSVKNELIYEPDSKEFARKEKEYIEEVKENIKRFCKTETELKLLLWLFPDLYFAFKDEVNLSIMSYRPNQVLRNNICVDNSFDSYFSTGINIDDPTHITNKELTEFTATTSDKTSMLTYLEKCKEKGKLELLIEILRDVCKTDSFIPVKKSSDFVAAMFDVQCLTSRKQRAFFTIDTRSKCKEIICSYLRKDLRTTKKIMLEAINKTESLYPILSFLFDQKQKIEVGNTAALLDKNEIYEIITPVLKKIENYYKNDRDGFFKNDDLEDIIGYWYHIDNIHFESIMRPEIKSVNKLCELMINLYKMRLNRDEYYYPYGTTGYFADLDVVYKKLENALKRNSLDKRHKIIAKYFIANYQYRDLQIGMTTTDDVKQFDAERDTEEVQNA